MFIFHEGMPGSGKSFAAMKDHIIPALQKGRKVFARMNGLDREKIGELTGRTVEELESLLIDIEESQVPAIYQHVEKDALVVIDELQNFFPKSRAQLSPEMTKFIAEHRHHGLDILAMGQLLKDCHSTWINRCNRKIQFLNKDVLGKPNEYKWKMFNGTPDDKGNVRFNEVTSGSADYDPKLFGTYRSFREETENTERLTDQRAIIWSSPVFRKWLPILGLVAFGGIGYMVYLFSGGLAPAPKAPQVKTADQDAKHKLDGPAPTRTVTENYVDGKLVSVTKEGAEETRPKAPQVDGSDWPDPVTDYSKENRIRVAAVVRAKKTTVMIEWRDSAMQVYDTLTGDQLRMLGWSILVGDDDQTVLLTRGEKRVFANAWPIPKPLASVPEEQGKRIRDESRKMGNGAPPALAMAPQPEQ